MEPRPFYYFIAPPESDGGIRTPLGIQIYDGPGTTVRENAWVNRMFTFEDPAFAIPAGIDPGCELPCQTPRPAFFRFVINGESSGGTWLPWLYHSGTAYWTGEIELVGYGIVWLVIAPVDGECFQVGHQVSCKLVSLVEGVVTEVPLLSDGIGGGILSFSTETVNLPSGDSVSAVVEGPTARCHP